jgi:hypothetical protein
VTPMAGMPAGLLGALAAIVAVHEVGGSLLEVLLGPLQRLLLGGDLGGGVDEPGQLGLALPQLVELLLRPLLLGLGVFSSRSAALLPASKPATLLS